MLFHDLTPEINTHASQFIDMFGQASTGHHTGAQKIRIISGCMAISLAG